MSVLEQHTDKWVPEPNTGCYLWTGAVAGGGGRPMVGVGRDWRPTLVSRLVCEEVYGPPPTPDHQAAHNTPNGCVGGLCVNGDHLRWATRKENYADMTPEARSAGGYASWVNNKKPRNLCLERQEAKAAGAATYFTGKLCKNGHISRRHTASGDCVTCRSEWNAQRQT